MIAFIRMFKVTSVRLAENDFFARLPELHSVKHCDKMSRVNKGVIFVKKEKVSYLQKTKPESHTPETNLDFSSLCLVTSRCDKVLSLPSNRIAAYQGDLTYGDLTLQIRRISAGSLVTTVLVPILASGPIHDVGNPSLYVGGGVHRHFLPYLSITPARFRYD